MTDRHPDLITVALALVLVAATLLIDALVAAGHIAAQVLDAIAGHDQHQPPGGGSTALPVVITTATTPSSATSANAIDLAGLRVVELRQLARRVGAAGWWSLNRASCLAVITAGGAA